MFMAAATDRIGSLVQKVKLGLQTKDPQILGILVAVIVVITSILFLIVRRRRNLRRGVLIMGLCDSGKTLLFSHLVHNKSVQTHTSIKDNSGYLSISSKGILRILDIPGHERLRARFFDQFKSAARAVVFVIDSVTFQKEIRDVADFLYNILTDPVVSFNCPSLLILCNKQDQAMAKGAVFIQVQLQKELNTLRFTHANRLQGTMETSQSNILGKQGKDFEFSHLHPIKVEFAESSMPSTNEVDIDALTEWLVKIA